MSTIKSHHLASTFSALLQSQRLSSGNCTWNASFWMCLAPARAFTKAPHQGYLLSVPLWALPRGCVWVERWAAAPQRPAHAF